MQKRRIGTAVGRMWSGRTTDEGRPYERWKTLKTTAPGCDDRARSRRRETQR